MKYQDRIEAERLVFIDETWTKTNMAPLRGWAPRGERLIAKVRTAIGTPPPSWRRCATTASMRHGSYQAPSMARASRPISGRSCFQPCAPAISSSWTISVATKAKPCGSSSVRPALSCCSYQILARPQSDRAGLRQAASTAKSRSANPRHRLPGNWPNPWHIYPRGVCQLLQEFRLCTNVKSSRFRRPWLLCVQFLQYLCKPDQTRWIVVFSPVGHGISPRFRALIFQQVLVGFGIKSLSISGRFEAGLLHTG